MKAEIKFKPQDLWVGAYVEKDVKYVAQYSDGREIKADRGLNTTRAFWDTYEVFQPGGTITIHPNSITEIVERRVYVCLLPMLPIKISWSTEKDVSAEYL